jgi:single-strand DNA-binding protein
LKAVIQTRKWQDQEGRDRYTTEVKARSVQALDPKTQQRPVDDGWGKDLDDGLFSEENNKTSPYHSSKESKKEDDPFDAPF